MGTMNRSEAAQSLFEEIRKIDNRLRWLGDTLHPELGLTAAKRSILLTLSREGPQTVPDIARERLVSRQVVQTQINDLIKADLVAPRKNPKHRRSTLIALTPSGRECIRKMLAKEKKLIESTPSNPGFEEMETLRAGLHRFREALEDLDPHPQ